MILKQAVCNTLFRTNQTQACFIDSTPYSKYSEHHNNLESYSKSVWIYLQVWIILFSLEFCCRYFKIQLASNDFNISAIFFYRYIIKRAFITTLPNRDYANVYHNDFSRRTLCVTCLLFELITHGDGVKCSIRISWFMDFLNKPRMTVG